MKCVISLYKSRFQYVFSELVWWAITQFSKHSIIIVIVAIDPLWWRNLNDAYKWNIWQVLVSIYFEGNWSFVSTNFVPSLANRSFDWDFRYWVHVFIPQFEDNKLFITIRFSLSIVVTVSYLQRTILCRIERSIKSIDIDLENRRIRRCIVPQYDEFAISINFLNLERCRAWIFSWFIRRRFQFGTGREEAEILWSDFRVIFKLLSVEFNF